VNNQQLLTLWLGSFRYYLGRRTYAVSDFCQLLIQEWRSLPSQVQNLIRKELAEAIAKDNEMRAAGKEYLPLGMDCDRAEWVKVWERIVNTEKPVERTAEKLILLFCLNDRDSAEWKNQNRHRKWEVVKRIDQLRGLNLDRCSLQFFEGFSQHPGYRGLAHILDVQFPGWAEEYRIREEEIRRLC
jgi:hypothetical protein